MSDLWPDDIERVDTIAPVAILRAQATVLKEKTNRLVEARVVPADILSTDIFRYSFFIRAPAVNGYMFRLFAITHKITLYPVLFDLDEDIFQEVYLLDDIPKFFTPNEDGEIEAGASNEKDFKELLTLVFKSKKTIKIIQSLMAQSEGVEGAKFAVSAGGPND